MLIKLISVIMQFLSGSENGYSEPTAYIQFKNGRTAEIVQERNGLDKKEYYFSCLLHCTEEEFDNDIFHKRCGVVESWATKNLSLFELARMIIEIMHTNNSIPVSKVEKENHPECFETEKDNPYPLCVGRGLDECYDCQLRADWEPEDPYGVGA